MSQYMQLKGILEEVKSEKITLNDALNKIQLKDTKPTRPYCKVTSSGALALYGVTKQPIVMYAEQWTRLSKMIKSNYVENYMKYNENRLKFKYPKKSNNESNLPKDNLNQTDELINSESIEKI